MSKIQQIDPKSLTPSPLLAGIWMLNTIGLEHTDLEYAAGAASVAAGGVQVPIVVIKGTSFIADGRHRHQWALAAGLATVPVVEVAEADAMSIIQRETFARRSMSRGQKAWAYLCLHPDLAEGKAGKPVESDINVRFTLETGAEAAGVSRSLMKEAAALYRLMATDKRFTKAKNAAAARHDVELRIWQGDGLGQIIADIKDGPGKDKPAKSPQDAVEAAAEEAARVADDYTRMLLEWGTELNTVKGYALLPPLALHTTSTELTGHAASMAVAAIARPDLPAAQKSHIVDALRQALAQATAAAKAAGLKA